MHSAQSTRNHRSRSRPPAVLAIASTFLAGTVSVVGVAASGVAGAGTSGAASVLDHGASANDAGDDTAGFLRAQDAALASDVRYADGPNGRAQAVVYVPPGTYRLFRLAFRSNVRLEVDAGAVLQQAGGRNVPTNPAPALIVWDSKSAIPLTNVTLVGVNSSSGRLKAQADPVFPGWSLDRSFTFNLDPAATNATQLVSGLMALNVDGFLIENVYSIQNDSQPDKPPRSDAGWWPQTRRAALNLRERNDTPPDGSVFYDPHNGTVRNWYNINAPRGYGPNQVNAGHRLRFERIFSDGGVAMRFETDASQYKRFASELRSVRASDVAGRNCNRAVTFAPHSQDNYDVHVTGVQAVGCGNGVIESFDESNTEADGSFVDSTIADVTVSGGNKAQLGRPGTNGMWTVGTSQQAFSKDVATRARWSVVYEDEGYACRGPFRSASDLIRTSSGFERPVCE